MNKVRIATLKNNLSRYLAYVRNGGEVLVLDRDTPVARLVPLTDTKSRLAPRASVDRVTDERLAEMERQGLISRGNAAAVVDWLERHAPIKLADGSGSVVTELLEMRDEDTR